MNDIEHLIYKNYLAEQEMINRLSVLEIKSRTIHETSELIQLNESVKDTVMTYIRKIMANIQEVWNKFKSSISSAADLKRIQPYRKKYFETDFVLKIPEGFDIPLITEYEKMAAVKVPAFQESMLDYLSDEKEFTRRHFNYFYDEKKSPKEVAEGKIFKKAEENGKDTANRENIATFLEFVEKYKEKADVIANDIKNLNNSSRSIENLLNQQQVSVNASASFEDTYRYYFNEAETFDSANKEEEDTNNNQDQNNEENKKKDSETSGKITNYFRVCNTILSAKLSLTNKMRSFCTTLLIQFGKLQEKNKDNKEEKKPEENTENNSGGAAQVNI